MKIKVCEKMVERDELRDIINKLNRYDIKGSSIIVLGAQRVSDGVWKL